MRRCALSGVASCRVKPTAASPTVVVEVAEAAAAMEAVAEEAVARADMAVSDAAVVAGREVSTTMGMGASTTTADPTGL